MVSSLVQYWPPLFFFFFFENHKKWNNKPLTSVDWSQLWSNVCLLQPPGYSKIKRWIRSWPSYPTQLWSGRWQDISTSYHRLLKIKWSRLIHSTRCNLKLSLQWPIWSRYQTKLWWIHVFCTWSRTPNLVYELREHNSQIHNPKPLLTSLHVVKPAFVLIFVLLRIGPSWSSDLSLVVQAIQITGNGHMARTVLFKFGWVSNYFNALRRRTISRTVWVRRFGTFSTDPSSLLRGSTRQQYEKMYVLFCLLRLDFN